MPLEFEIVPLAKCPNAIGLLSEWFFSEWNRLDKRTVSEIEQQLRENLAEDRLPITFLAIRDSEILGTVSLDLSDLPGYEHLSPWLASLYVLRKYRRQGIGRLLLLHAIDFSRAKKIPALYLWTAGPKKLYEQFGWRELLRTNYAHKQITVLRRDSRQE